MGKSAATTRMVETGKASADHDLAARPRPTSRYELAGLSGANAHEAEADRVAARVVDNPSRLPGARTNPIARNAGLQSLATTSAPASVDAVVGRPGRQLGTTIRSEMEQELGCDFSRVRIHADGEAAASARELGAHAYTVGENIVFGANEFAPHSLQGRRLIAHELTHVNQQRGSALGGRLVQRKPIEGAKKASKKQSTIVAIHAKPNELEASAYLAGERTPIGLKLSKNMLPEGKYEFIKADDPNTPKFVEFKSDAGKAFVWHCPPGKYSGSKVMVTVEPGEFNLETYAQQRFDAVPDRIKSRLYSKRGKKLETAQEKMGFADFAERLQKRGITDEELILFQKRAQSGVVWRHIDWATEWMEAADVVIGERAELEKKAATNITNFMQQAESLPKLSDAAVSLYRNRDEFLGLAVLADSELQESGISLDELTATIDSMMLSFDSQMRLETAVALSRLEGGLLLMKERYVEDRKGTDALVQMRAAAGKEPTLELKAAKNRAADEVKSAKRDLAFDPLSIAASSFGLGDSQKLKRVAEAEEKHQKANSDYMKQLEAISGMPIRSWRGFNAEQFFYGRSGATTPQYLLGSYIKQALNDLERARKKIDGDRRTLYKCDVMVRHTKKVMGIEDGTTIDKLIDDRVEEYKKAPWWDRLIDILSLALMFIPGGAFFTAARLAVGVAQTINTVNDESTNEILSRPNLKTTGGSGTAVFLAFAGNALDFVDVAGKSVSLLNRSSGAADDVATRLADDAFRVSDDVGSKAAKTDLPTTQATTHTDVPMTHRTSQPELPTHTAPDNPVVRNETAPPAREVRDQPVSPPTTAKTDAPVADAPVYGPVHDASLAKETKDLREVPLGEGPQLGQRMGARTNYGPDRPRTSRFTDEQRRAMAETEKQMADAKTADAMRELQFQRRDMHDAIASSPVRTQSRQSMAEIYASNPTRMTEFYDDWLKNQAKKAAADRDPNSFGQYVKHRLSGERGAAGELTDAFVRGADEIMVKAPKPKSNLPGSDSMSYRPSDKRIKYLDNKALTTGSTVDQVSALERNLIKNMSDDIVEIEIAIRNTDVPDVIAKNILPRLKSARDELVEYAAKNPVTKANATQPEIRDAFASILRNHGIDRVVTTAGSGSGVGIGKKLADDARFKVE